MRLILFVIIFIGKISAFACGNEHYYSISEIPYKEGKIDLNRLLNNRQMNEYEIELPYWMYKEDRTLFDRLDSVEKAIKSNKDYKLLTDYAWLKIKFGKVKEAMVILDSLYKIYPNDYNILANLGTANELIGNNKRALELLTKATSINPGSHFGSEWIHVNILKEKITKANLKSLICNLDVHSYDYKQWLNSYKTNEELDSLLKAIAYQLHERIFFVKSPDAFVGQLLSDFADLVVKRYSFEEAIPFFFKAVAYDKELESAVQNRLETYSEIKAKNEALFKDEVVEQKTKWWKYGLFFLGGGIFVFLLRMLIKKRP